MLNWWLDYLFVVVVYVSCLNEDMSRRYWNTQHFNEITHVFSFMDCTTCHLVCTGYELITVQIMIYSVSHIWYA